MSSVARQTMSSVARRTRESERGQMQRGHALARCHETELLAGHQQRQILADPAHSVERLVVRLSETEVLHWMRDLAVEDRERAVARHAGHDRSQLMHPACVVEARHEDATLHAGDELFACLLAGLEA